MSTFLELIDQVDNALSAFTDDQTRRTYLTQALDASAITFQVDEPTNVTRGLVEVDSELMWVKRVDQASSLVTLIPNGRGYRSTGATAHAINSTILDSPTYPRSQIRWYINEVISNMFPDMYAVKSHEFPMVGARSTYGIPAETQWIYRITWETIGPSLDWADISRWEFNGAADTTRFPTGRSVDIWDLVVPGRTVKVDYVARPGQLVSDNDDFVTATGLPDYCETAVIHGACYRMAAVKGIARLQTKAVESQARDVYVNDDSAIQASQYFHALYQEAVSSCRSSFLNQYPTKRHFRSW